MTPMVMVSGVDRLLYELRFAADEDAAEMPPDQPDLDGVARADAVGGPVEPAQPPHRGEPVGVLQVGGRLEHLVRGHRHGRGGTGLDHGCHGTTLCATPIPYRISVANSPTVSKPSRV